MPFGVCKMCLQEKNLVSSHLIPRKVYEYCNQEGHNPIVLTDDVLMASDRQWQYPLLCIDCETILNEGGEDWCVTKLATYEKTFPLYDLVSAKPPVDSVGTTNIFFVKNMPEVKAKEIVHFGMGMFFKAAVHGWRKGMSEPRINLEPYSLCVYGCAAKQIFPRICSSSSRWLLPIALKSAFFRRMKLRVTCSTCMFPDFCSCWM